MIVYEICGDEGSAYFATLSEAREHLAFYPEGTPLDKLWLADLPPKKLAVRLLNHEQFVQKREHVA